MGNYTSWLFILECIAVKVHWLNISAIKGKDLSHPFAEMEKSLCVTVNSSCEGIGTCMQVSNMCQAEPKIPQAQQPPPVCASWCKDEGQFYSFLRQAHVHRAPDGVNVPFNLRWRDTWLSVEEILGMLHLRSVGSGSYQFHSRTKIIQGQDNMWVSTVLSEESLQGSSGLEKVELYLNSPVGEHGL